MKVQGYDSTCRVAFDTQFARVAEKKVPWYSTWWVAFALTMQRKAYIKEIQPENWVLSMDVYHIILCSKARALVTQFVWPWFRRPKFNTGWISMSYSPPNNSAKNPSFKQETPCRLSIFYVSLVSWDYAQQEANRQTHRPSTVTLAAHACRGLIITNSVHV